MARVVMQYTLQDLGMHQRAIEERRGHGYDRNREGNTGRVTYGRAVPRLSQAIGANFEIQELGRTWVAHQDGVDKLANVVWLGINAGMTIINFLFTHAHPSLSH